MNKTAQLDPAVGPLNEESARKDDPTSGRYSRLKELKRRQAQERTVTAHKGNREMRKYATYFADTPKPKLNVQSVRNTPFKQRPDVTGDANGTTTSGGGRNTFRKRHTSIKVERTRKKAASPTRPAGETAKSTMQERKKPEEIVPAINDPEKVISEDLIRKELKLKGIRLKIAQAQVDKIEIMRDLAAYEVNFASSCGVQQNLQSLLGKLISTEELLLRRRGGRHHEQ